MINVLADFKSKDLTIKVFVGPDFFVVGRIRELNPEYLVLDQDGKRVVVQMSRILYFHEA